MEKPEFFSLDEIREKARALLQNGEDVRERLRALTVEALTRRQLAEQEIREVLTAITEGVSLGATERANEVKSALESGLRGMDDALGNAAEAMHLALEEASGQARDFVEQDVQQGLSDLKKLETMFLETLSQVAQQATGLVRQEMTALAEHARNTGTGTGERLRDVAEDFGNRVRATAQQAGDAGRQAAREIGSRVALLASRKLADLATRIEQKAQALKDK
jgi:vacuolar-type H+-ATPase catalytic subunit A/Vma1